MNKKKTTKKLHPIFKDSKIRETTEEDLYKMKSYSYYGDMNYSLALTKLEIAMIYLTMIFLLILFSPMVILYITIMGLLNLFDD